MVKMIHVRIVEGNTTNKISMTKMIFNNIMILQEIAKIIQVKMIFKKKNKARIFQTS